MLRLKGIRVTVITFLGHVTSSVTWSFDSHHVICYRSSIDTNPPGLYECTIGTVMYLTYLSSVKVSHVGLSESVKYLGVWVQLGVLSVYCETLSRLTHTMSECTIGTAVYLTYLSSVKVSHVGLSQSIKYLSVWVQLGVLSVYCETLSGLTRRHWWHVHVRVSSTPVCIITKSSSSSSSYWSHSHSHCTIRCRGGKFPNNWAPDSSGLNTLRHLSRF